MLRPSQRQSLASFGPAPLTFNLPAATSVAGFESPVQISVNARTVDSTTTSSSCPGSSRQRSAVSFSTTSHHSRSRAGASVN